MKKFHALLIISLLLFCSGAFAADVFTGNVRDNIEFKVEGIANIARYYPTANKTSILAGTERVLVQTGSCQNLGQLKYCVTNAWTDENATTGVLEGVVTLKVQKAGPDLVVTIDPEKDTPSIDEEIAVVVKIENKGNERASGIVYEESFQKDVKVSGGYFDSSINGISWKGGIDAGSSAVINYRLKFAESSSVTSVGVVTYSYDGKIYKSNVTRKYTVDLPFLFNTSLSRSGADVGDELNFTAIIKNKVGSDLTVSRLEVKIPESLSVLRRGIDFKADGSSYIYSGTLEGSQTKNITLVLRADSAGIFNISSVLDVKSGTKSLSGSDTATIRVGTSALTPIIEFTPSTVESGEEFTAIAYIVNDAGDNMTGISLNVASDLTEPKSFSDIALAPGKKYDAINKLITAPSVAQDRDYFIKLSGSYSKDGRVKDFDLMKKVRVIAKAQVLVVNSTARREGQITNVTVTISNIGKGTITELSIVDTIPKGSALAAGARDAEFSAIAAGKNVSFSYAINSTSPSQVLEIMHTLSAKDSESAQLSMDTQEIVNVAEINPTIPSNVTNTTDTVVATDKNSSNTTSISEEPVKKGIFARIVGWFKGLFS